MFIVSDQATPSFLFFGGAATGSQAAFKIESDHRRTAEKQKIISGGRAAINMALLTELGGKEQDDLACGATLNRQPGGITHGEFSAPQPVHSCKFVKFVSRQLHRYGWRIPSLDLSVSLQPGAFSTPNLVLN